MKDFLSRLARATAVIGAGGLLAATAAQADTISVGLAINGGAITTEATGTGNAGITGLSFGGYDLNNVSGTGSPFVSAGTLLNTNSLNASSVGTKNVLDVFVTDQNITSNTGLNQFLSSFTENSGGITAGWTVTESTYLDSGNGQYALTTLLGTNTFTAGGFTTDSMTANAGPGPYSVTAEYVVSSNGLNGSANSTINVSVPEPATFALFGVGLLGCALVVGRRRLPNA